MILRHAFVSFMHVLLCRIVAYRPLTWLWMVCRHSKSTIWWLFYQQMNLQDFFSTRNEPLMQSYWQALKSEREENYYEQFIIFENTNLKRSSVFLAELTYVTEVCCIFLIYVEINFNWRVRTCIKESMNERTRTMCVPLLTKENNRLSFVYKYSRYQN